MSIISGSRGRSKVRQSPTVDHMALLILSEK